MADTRRKNVNWELKPTPETISFDGAQLAVLMDIRDELKQLNGYIGCRNFLRLPSIIDKIEANTKKRKYTKKEKP